MNNPNIVDCAKGSKSRKIAQGTIYRITEKEKAKQTTVRVGFPEYKTVKGSFQGIYPQLIFEQARFLHNNMSKNSFPFFFN